MPGRVGAVGPVPFPWALHFFFLAVQGIEPWAFYMLGSILPLSYPHPHFFL